MQTRKGAFIPMDEMTTTVDAVTPVISVRHLATLCVYVSDKERAVRFYKEMLGLQEGEQMLEPGVTLQLGETMIYISDGREPMEREPMKHPEISIAFVVSSVKESFEKLRNAGVTIVEEYNAPSPYFASFSIADPDGNILQIWGKP
jgi:predicted enzyme related to lactoylglutathione lyase